MKILHIGLASHFTDKMLYQENILTDLNAKAGHNVMLITDTYEFKSGILEEVEECDKLLENGVRLIRIKYDWIINKFVTNKIQKAKKIRQYLYDFKPDTIMYHGVCGYELMDVARYVKKYDIPLYIDSHENFKNTAMTPISKFAYKYVHGFFIKKALPIVKKILYIGYPERDYLIKMYKIPESLLEFYPLGGIVVDFQKQSQYRDELIKKMQYPKDAFICTHSGKMDKGKKTEEVIKAFSRVEDKRLRLIIYGMIPDDMYEVLTNLIENDKRISFLGWKTPSEQELILGATDLYIQPGTYSATAQIALCCGCALILNNGYREMMENAVFFEEDSNGIEKVLRLLLSDMKLLQEHKEICYNLALNKFDYTKLANRYLK